MSKKAHRAAELAALKIGAKESGVTDAVDERDRYLRLAAEFDNYKKRTVRQFGEIVEKANEGLIIDLLDVIDDFERALNAVAVEEMTRDDHGQNLFTGTKMICEKLTSVLRSKGVGKMEVLGRPFDPVFHEAVMKVPSEKAEGTIIDVVSPGYTRDKRVIRHAKVVVAAPEARSNNQ